MISSILLSAMAVRVGREAEGAILPMFTSENKSAILPERDGYWRRDGGKRKVGQLPR